MTVIKKTFLMLTVLMLCHTSALAQSDMGRARQKAVILESQRSVAAIKQPYGQDRLESDIRALQAFSAELQRLAKEMLLLQKTVGLKKRGHFTSDEHDRIEGLLFRYLAIRESLWDMVGFYSNYKEMFSDPGHQTKGFIIAFNAALHLTYYSSRMVVTFIDEPGVIAKLNEAYYRYNIPAGTFDKLLISVTDIENLEAIKTSWQLFTEEELNKASALSKLISTDSEFKQLVDQINRLYADSDIQIQLILERRSLLLPEVRNRLRHTAIVSLVKKAQASFADNLYAAQSVLFERVSQLKTPLAAQIRFAPGQLQALKAQLQPGDIILTFTDGYMSNIFLPGKFKHGITYVGSPAQRKKAGLTRWSLRNVPEVRRGKLKQDLKVSRLPDNHEADLIEAVAQGVVFNSLEHMARTHLTRLVVLRPKLTREERIQQLLTVFQLLGNSYDFDFDFNDASSQCCTEVIYRSLYKKGGIEFPLTARMGKQTLSADDIIEYHLAAEDRPFELVLLARTDPSSESGRAQILAGREGEKQFCRLMERPCP